MHIDTTFNFGLKLMIEQFGKNRKGAVAYLTCHMSFGDEKKKRFSREKIVL